ncbi:hypothetical protein [Novipirellula artificiosorum]|uniref:Uncharacterized protein n=1 Tax=Novipirellula artificiosorum TaxID=2528016 RepID=A0A5C6DWB0_9BACT|nr:hypothetical protein [Novipirellula artificiosorum]TWU39691.1 hypothetical protein Poly41_25470 [Novipirellula artificiosorum]
MRSIGVLFIWVVFSASGVVNACNIPVFRYALERWRPDDLEVILYFDGQLRGAEQTYGSRLEQASSATPRANAQIIRVDVSSLDDGHHPQQAERLAFWADFQRRTNATLPYLVVRSKPEGSRSRVHFRGTLSEAKEIDLFDSPARRELHERLVAGHSIVWILMGAPNHPDTVAVRELAETNFETLARKIKLPEGIGLPGSELFSDVPLVQKYSLLEIDPRDNDERFLVSMLSGVRKDAFEQGEPLLVPVYGRGRALEVIPVSEFNLRLVEDLTLFLSGACSCQVKERNPGFDLLITADWDRDLFGEDGKLPDDRSDLEGQNLSPVLLQIPPGRKP